jgi:hypothetical protein
MIALAALGSLAFILVGAVIGVRLLLLWRKTRELPELLMGLSLTLFAMVVQPAIVSSNVIGHHFGNNARLAALAFAFGGVTTMLVCLYRFTFIVFRPESKLARVWVWFAGCVMVGTSIALVWSISQSTPGAGHSILTQICVFCFSTNFLIAMLWIAIESLRYRSLLLRRLALGLTDPVLVNRFGLWGSGCGIAGLSPIGTMICAAMNIDIATHPVPLLNTAITGTWIAFTWYLSLLPPQSYLDWVRARAARTKAG